jgi:hypothetical protein
LQIVVGLASDQLSSFGRAALYVRMWLHSFWKPMEMSAVALHVVGFTLRMYNSNARLDGRLLWPQVSLFRDSLRVLPVHRPVLHAWTALLHGVPISGPEVVRRAQHGW